MVDSALLLSSSTVPEKKMSVDVEKATETKSETTTTSTTTTDTITITINIVFLKSWPVILKLIELILGIVTVGLVGYYLRNDRPGEIFFLLMATTFMIGTFVMLLSSFISDSASSTISKSVQCHDLIYNSLAFLLLLIASLTLVIEIHSNSTHWDYAGLFFTSLIGLGNSALYFLSARFAQNSYTRL